MESIARHIHIQGTVSTIKVCQSQDDPRYEISAHTPRFVPFIEPFQASMTERFDH